MAPTSGRGSRAAASRRPPSRRRESRQPLLFRGLGAAVVLLVLLAGVPLLLVWLVGDLPIPTSLPSRETLTQPIGVEQLVDVLVVVTWLAWLQFVVCVLVEFGSELSGVGLPRRVPLAGPSQRLARVLVSSLLVLLTIGGTTGAASASVAAHPPATSHLTPGRPTARRGTVKPPKRQLPRSAAGRSTSCSRRGVGTTTACGTSPTGAWAKAGATRRSSS
jgi:hypothetical protein